MSLLKKAQAANDNNKNTMNIARTLLYIVGFGCFLHVMLVGPPKAPVEDDSNDGLEQSFRGKTTTVKDMSTNQQTNDDSVDVGDDLTKPHLGAKPAVAAKRPPAPSPTKDAQLEAPCPPDSFIPKKTLYRTEFEKLFPVEVPYTPVDDWDAVPCTKIPKNCNLKDPKWGNPFILISFGRSGTTSTWDIIAGLTGEFIPHASEDEGKDKAAARDFFAGQNQTESGKCWLQRLLCQKQLGVKKAFKEGLGKSSMYGTKWKPWHQGLNTTQAREALQWVGTQPYIKVVYNTRNMVDMYISKSKHQVLEDLFGKERTAHCYDDKEIQLSDKTWQTLESLGIPRGTPCVQIFKEIEARMEISIPRMFDFFEKNRLQTDFAGEMLDYYNVSSVTVTYEKLYFTDDADEWMRIFQYLGYGPQHNLTKDEVFAKTTFQKASSNDRSKRMANYDEVVAALRCTPYAQYLD